MQAILEGTGSPLERPLDFGNLQTTSIFLNPGGGAGFRKMFSSSTFRHQSKCLIHGQVQSSYRNDTNNALLKCYVCVLSAARGALAHAFAHKLRASRIAALGTSTHNCFQGQRTARLVQIAARLVWQLPLPPPICTATCAPLMCTPFGCTDRSQPPGSQSHSLCCVPDAPAFGAGTDHTPANAPPGPAA
eukprot:484682-Pelagomonas_calceolata.AAC.2